jgi:hypothetical protein
VYDVQVVRYGTFDVKVAVPETVSDLFRRDSRFRRRSEDLFDFVNRGYHLSCRTYVVIRRVSEWAWEEEGGRVEPCCSDVMSSVESNVLSELVKLARGGTGHVRTIVILVRVEASVVEFI